MFHVYVLRSERTGRRYVGSCKDLCKRLRRHNAGLVSATKNGIPWTLVHSETFLTRSEAIMRERYFKTGRGRNELDRIDSRPVTAAPHLRSAVLLACALLLTCTGAWHAQDAPPPTSRNLKRNISGCSISPLFDTRRTALCPRPFGRASRKAKNTP